MDILYIMVLVSIHLLWLRRWYIDPRTASAEGHSWCAGYECGVSLVYVHGR